MDGPYYEPGRYQGAVVSQALTESKNGNPQFVLTFQLIGQYERGELVSVNQYERTIWLTITDRTIDFVVKDLASLGFRGDKFSGLDPNTPGFHDFEGQTIEVECTHETYEGQTRERWRLFRDDLGRREFKPLESKQVRTLDALFGKALKAATAVNGAEATVEEVATVKAEPATDIPF